MPVEHQGQRATSVCGNTQGDESGSASAREREANRKRVGTEAMDHSIHAGLAGSIAIGYDVLAKVHLEMGEKGI